MTPWTVAHQASRSFPNSWSLIKLMSIKLVMPSNHLVLYRPFSSCFQSSLASGYFPMSWLFTLGGLRIGVSASVIPMNIQDWFCFGLTGLILIVAKGTLKSLLKHHSSKASIHQCSALFMAHLSHPYMTNEKTIALTMWTFLSKVVSLFFNMLSRLVMTFLPSSKHLLTS